MAETTYANPGSGSYPFTRALPDPHAAWWMAERLPPEAISIADQMPPQHKEVLGFVSAPEVAIHHFPVVIWWSDRLASGEIRWWGGLPGSYLDLRRWKWKVTHWLPLANASAALATGGSRG
ncbi:hypothetical protein A3862_27215 [Methylobacterium sp. XJLW]|jgi:hypothetical protein|uniref:hypothetical protein n=1 Tax=Methylobacterium sp. XJLW TaxID=739141 RepID=UPI000DAADDC8|nr:hypothetical protein [Methylobacterium sp. XJLW]AWV18774.1 hypothetical protein A3862_27215 [Methylobacterium sp. XJLW]